MTESAGHKTGKLGWIFPLGHGHQTQFLNFQECYPSELATRAEWIALRYAAPVDWIGRLPGVPNSLRVSSSLVLQIQQAIRESGQLEALFFAGASPLFLPFFRQFPSYVYTDFTLSGLRELSPWYDHLVKSHPVVLAGKALGSRLIFRAAVGAFAMSRWAALSIQREYGLPDSRVHVVLPGANLKRWQFVERSNRAPGSPVRLLFVGGEFARKGGDLLLDWAMQTQARNWELDIVTWRDHLPAWMHDAQVQQPAPDQQVSFSLGPRLPNVRVHCAVGPNSPTLLALYEAADVFCLPTYADGSSIASLEAMATGLPVLVGAVGGIPELIHDGETGLLLRRGDQVDLADKLEWLIRDAPARWRLGRNARRSCEDHFNIERQLRDITSVIARDCPALAQPA